MPVVRSNIIESINHLIESRIMKNLVLIMLVTMMALNTEANLIENRSDSNDHRWIDLGLPSGTLWATMNVGASSPEDYGDYLPGEKLRPKRSIL